MYCENSFCVITQNVFFDYEKRAAVVVSVDDEMVPAPDGNHELADGRVITTEGGVITAIEEAEAEAEVESEPEAEAEAEPARRRPRRGRVRRGRAAAR